MHLVKMSLCFFTLFINISAKYQKQNVIGITCSHILRRNCTREHHRFCSRNCHRIYIDVLEHSRRKCNLVSCFVRVLVPYFLIPLI